MQIISLKRGQGKTTELIKMSAKTGIKILVGTEANAKMIVEKAKEMNLKIKEPIVIQNNRPSEIVRDYCAGVRKFYIDELPLVLSNLLGGEIVEIATITETNELPTNVDILQRSLDLLIKKYSELINKGDYNVGLNVLKNIEMVSRNINEMNNQNVIIGDINISENVDCNTLANSIVEKLPKTLANKLNYTDKEIYKCLNEIELMCINENLYYCETLAEGTIKNSEGRDICKAYKRNLSLKQYKYKTYIHTVRENFYERNKEIK